MWRQPMSDSISLCNDSLCIIRCVNLCQNWSAYVDAAYVVTTYVGAAYAVTTYVGFYQPM